MTFIMLYTLSMVSCSHNKIAETSDPGLIEVTTPGNTTENAELQADSLERYNILVTKAVDAWFFQNLMNFGSFHRLIPKIESAGEEDGVYSCKYSIRYSATNAMGGTETHTLLFRVRLLINPQTEALESYEVVNITPPDSIESNGTLIRERPAK